MQELKRVDIVSVAKVSAIYMAVIGFVMGLFFTLIAVTFGAMASSLASGLGAAGTDIPGMAGTPAMGMLPVFGMIGAFSIVIFPILYGIMGFLFGLVGGAIYNFVAGRFGGIMIELK